VAIGLEMYLTYAEFNRGIAATGEEFQRELAKYRREDIVRFCIFSNNAIYGLGPDPSMTAHDEVVRNACPHEMLPVAVAAKLRTRPLFERQHILFVAKRAFQICTADGAPLLQGWSLARLFLMANDQNIDHAVNQLRIEKKDTLSLLGNFIPVVEANRLFPFQFKFTRPLLILNKIFPAYKDSPWYDLRKLFVEATGMAPEDYFGLIFAAFTACSRFKFEDILRSPDSLGITPDFIIAPKIPRSEVERFLNDISSDADEYQVALKTFDRGLFDFTVFKDKPMFRMGDRVYPIDLHFLGARCESALYWKCLERLSGKDKDDFRSFWGGLFQKYINWVLSQGVDGNRNKFMAGPTFEKSMEEIADGVVVCGSSAVLMEYKGGLFAASAKYDGDLESLKTDLEKKFVRTSKSRKGVLQLINSIEKIFPAKRPVDGVDFSQVTKIYPVLVIHDDIGGAWMMNTYLNEIFKALSGGKFQHLRNANGSKVTVTPLFCITADHLEIISESLDEHRFVDILDARYRADKQLRMAFLTGGNSVMGDKALRIPQFFNDEMRAFTDQLKARFDSGNME
jgi:hypothetical protein